MTALTAPVAVLSRSSLLQQQQEHDYGRLCLDRVLQSRRHVDPVPGLASSVSSPNVRLASP
jgi:hypothetical protein